MSKIFVLDIGTRSVVGLVLTQKETGYRLEDLIVKEHHKRAMMDGQIHDITAVAEVILEIKTKLEESHGPINRVCVAAAGRSLKTIKEQSSIEVKNKPLLNKQDIYHLELQAVQNAQFQLAKTTTPSTTTDYCVGYSVLHYYLDGEEIGNLIDQQGETASVEVIATFLPKMVVESLMAALNRANLQMEALTLEPIAAINVLIPPSMRRLNVALIDVGAGTSDIAITASGTVIAYGMVPMAGDEVTEAISDQFLLDFPQAESVKRELTTNESITFTDILGFSHTYSPKTIVDQITPTIHSLAESIMNALLQLNHKSPQAVMLIGGGSLTPKLGEAIASKLGLPSNRVAIRGTEAITQIEVPESFERGPELVTPLGIAVAAKEHPIEYITVTVNERAIRLFDIKSLSLGDSLLAAGVNMKQLYGKPGSALVYTINGMLHTLPGEKGGPPVFKNNGEWSTLDTLIKDGDRIYFERGQNGAPANAKLKDILAMPENKRVYINNQEYPLPMTLHKNGKPISLEDELNDRDELEVRTTQTVHDVFDSLNIKIPEITQKEITIFVNHKPVSIGHMTTLLLINGKTGQPSSILEDGDHIVFSNSRDTEHTILKLKEVLNLKPSFDCPITFNGKALTLSMNRYTFYRNNQELNESSPLFDHDQIEYRLKESIGFIFQDVFRYVDIDLSDTLGKTFTLTVNDEDATFHTPIKSHDSLKLIWSSSEKLG